MNTFTILTFFGGLCVIASFLSGVRAMARNGEVAKYASAEWMGWRVVFQAAVFLTILAAPLSH